MASIGILMGPAPAQRSVEALPFLPGLVVHKAPDAPGEDLYNITHRASGLAVLLHVREQDLPTSQRLLGDACWTVTPDEIFGDHEYYSLIRTVLQSLRGRDVLRNTEHEDRRRQNPGADWGFFQSVTTPRLYTKELAVQGKAVLEHAELSEFVQEGFRQGCVPALLVGISGKEDVAVVPCEVFPRGFFRDLRLSLEDRTFRGNVTITAEMADKTTRGHCVQVSFGKERFVVLGYLPFLRLAKRGLS